MTSVFISYSRTDQEFVRRLHSALAAAGHDAWVDWEDIPPSSQWLSEIDAGIAAADTVICVLSPDWVASATSQQEIADALANRKRIIPLVYREVPSSEVDPSVRALNWIFFRSTDDFDAAFKQLIFALDTDLDYWHLSSRLLVRARQWESGKENTSFVLRGKELAESERWLSEGADKQPTPTALQTRFITASRRASGRRQRTWIGLLSAGLIIAIVLGTLAQIQRVRADNATQLANQRNFALFSQVLAGDSSVALGNNAVDQALLLGAAATQRPPDTFQARSALLDALEYSPHLAATLGSDTPGTTGAGDGVAVAYSADGTTLMSADAGDGGDASRITLWDTATLRPRQQITLQDQGGVLAAALSPDGQMVATNGVNTGIRLYPTAAGGAMAQLAPPTEVDAHGVFIYTNVDVNPQQIAFSPTGNLVAAETCDTTTCAHPAVVLWNTHSHAVLGRLPLALQPRAVSLAISHDGQYLAMTQCDFINVANPCQLAMWNLATLTLVYMQSITSAQQGGYQVGSIAFSSDGSTLAITGCVDQNCLQGEVLTFASATGTEVGTGLLMGRGQPISVAFSPDGQMLAAARPDGALQLWNVATGAPFDAPLLGNSGAVRSIAFSPDSRMFATAGHGGKILLWRLVPFAPGSLLLGPNLDGSSPVAVSPDGKTLATANCDGKIRLWDRQTGTLRTTLDSQIPALCTQSLAFSRDGHLLAAGVNTGGVLVWDLQQFTLIYVVILCNCDDALVEHLTFGATENSLAASIEAFGFSSVVLVDLPPGNVAGTIVHSFTIPYGVTILGVAFNADGSVLAVGGSGKNYTGITLWSMARAQPIAELDVPHSGVRALAYDPAHPDILAAANSDGDVQLWDTRAHKMLSEQNVGQATTSLGFSPNGQTLAASSDEDGLITLWDTRDVHHLALYVRQIVEPNDVLNVVFTPDGRFLVDAEDTGPVNVRYATLAGWQQQACAIAGRNFTHAEWATFTTTQSEPYPTVCPALPVPKA